MAAGADRLHGPRFEYDDADGVRRELLGEAVADARGKAERLAAAGGRRLGTRARDRGVRTGPRARSRSREMAVAASAERPTSARAS